MQKITNKLSIILMDDTGKTRRFRCKTWVLKTLCAIAIISPIITGLVTWFSFEAWQTMMNWHQEKAQLEQALNENSIKLQTLAHLESLVMPSIPPALIQQEPPSPAPPKVETNTTQEVTTKGEVQATQKIPPKENIEPVEEVVIRDIESYKKPLNDLRFRLDNMEILVVEQDRLRINVNLFNADSSQILAGRLTFSLLYPDGTIQPLKTDGSTFRIRRYKKVLNKIRLDKDTLENIANCQLVAEIHMDNTVTFRSYYPIKIQ